MRMIPLSVSLILSWPPMWWEISNQRAAICWHWKWQKRLQIWHRHRNLRTKKWSAEMIKIDFVTMDWPSLEKNMTWSNHPILITPTLRTRPDHKEGCQDQARTCRIAGTEFWNGRGIRRAWQSGSLAVTLNKCAMQIVSFRPVLSVLSFWRRWGIRSVNSSGQGLGQADSRQNKGSLNKNCSWIQLLDFKTNRLQTVSDLLQRLRRLTSERVTNWVAWFCRGFVVSSLWLLLPSVRGTYPSSPLQV